MGKAPKGDGYARKQGGTWVQWLDLGKDDDGRRIRKKVTGQSRDEVRLKIREIRARHEGGADVRKKPGLVADLVTKYLESVDVRPRTLAAYRYVSDRFIVPKLGSRPAAKVTPADVRHFLTQLRKEPHKPRGKQPKDAPTRTIGPKTIGLVQTVLSQVFELAIADRLITSNPVRRVPQVKQAKSPARALNDQQAAALLQALQGDRLEVAVRLLLSLGLRRGECAALKLDDLDLEAGTLRIDATMGYVPGVGRHYGPPKTQSGARVMPLPAGILAALRWHLRQRETEQRLMGWGDAPWLFRGVASGGPLNSNAIYETFRRAAARAGLEGFTPHSLRHSCATFLLAEGVPVHIAAEILGHKDAAELLRTYAHQLPGQQAAALDRLADRLDRRASGE